MSVVDRLLHDAVSHFLKSASDEEIKAAVKRVAKKARDPSMDIPERGR